MVDKNSDVDRPLIRGKVTEVSGSGDGWLYTVQDSNGDEVDKIPETEMSGQHN